MSDLNLVPIEFIYLATTACNYRCIHCHPNFYTAQENEIPSKLIIKQYKKSKYLKHHSINIAGGEPFLKRDLNELVIYLADNNIPCIITTNGRYTDRIEKLIEQLKSKNKCVRFAVSIDGTEEVHNKIRGGEQQNAFYHAMNSVKLLKLHGFEVQINMVVQKSNFHQLNEMGNEFKKLGVTLNYIPKISYEDEFEFTEEEVIQLYPFIKSQREKKILLSKGNYKIKNCHAALNSWFIDSTGNVFACSGSYTQENNNDFIIGNLQEKDFDDIMESDNRLTIYNDNVKKCQGCSWPCEIVRETEKFNMNTAFSKNDISLFANKISTENNMVNDFSLDNQNWHDLEENNEGFFRWMKGKSAILFLKNNKECRYLNIKFYIPEFIQEEKVILNVFIDNNYISQVKSVVGINDITIPFQNKWDNIIEVKLSTNLEWCPKDINMGMDTRKLGIAVYIVAIK